MNPGSTFTIDLNLSSSESVVLNGNVYGILTTSPITSPPIHREAGNLFAQTPYMRINLYYSLREAP